MRPPSVKRVAAALQAAYFGRMMTGRADTDVTRHEAGAYVFYLYAQPSNADHVPVMLYRVVAVRGDPASVRSVRREGEPIRHELTKTALRAVVQSLVDRCESVAAPPQAMLANERRRAARARRRGRKVITCVICGERYAPKPSEHNVLTHPGPCRDALVKARWDRAAARKKARRASSPENRL